MSHFKVRQHQRNRRQGGDIFTKPGVDPTDPVVQKGCTGKRGKYRNRKWAAGAAARSTAKHGVKFRSYHCPHCGCYHLTTNAPRDLRFKTKGLVLNQTTRILTAISSEEPSSFSEILSGLNGDRPEDKAGFREFFDTLRALEQGGLVEVDWGPNNRLNSAQLTSLGAERAREALKGQNNGF